MIIVRVKFHPEILVSTILEPIPYGRPLVPSTPSLVPSHRRPDLERVRTVRTTRCFQTKGEETRGQKVGEFRPSGVWALMCVCVERDRVYL